MSLRPYSYYGCLYYLYHIQAQLCPKVGLEGNSMAQLIKQLATELQHLNSNLPRAVSEGCFIFYLTSLFIEVLRPIQSTVCTNVAVKREHLMTFIGRPFYPISIQFPRKEHIFTFIGLNLALRRPFLLCFFDTEAQNIIRLTYTHNETRAYPCTNMYIDASV